jgi:hypothetical protein
MPFDLTPTTELEAVNMILASVGEAPVASLDNGFVDAEMALNQIRSVSKQVQSRGWHFNTELEYALNPAVDGTIHLPQNVLRVITQQGEQDYTQRGLKLYDRRTRSYTFTSTITVDLVVGLDFELLPEPARQFITVRAARRFQDQYNGAETTHRFSARDEMSAWSSLENFEAETARHNVLTSSALMTRIRGNR